MQEISGGAVLPRLAGCVKHPKNIHAHSREECEVLLAEMIQQPKAEIAAEKNRLRNEEKAS